MEFKKYQNYLTFLISILLFIICISYSLYLFITWDRDVETTTTQVEVSLPVIDLNTYSGLSKQYQY